MSLFNRVYTSIEEKRERVLSGKINCIPWGLPRFESQLPGIEQGKYYLITANSQFNFIINICINYLTFDK